MSFRTMLKKVGIPLLLFVVLATACKPARELSTANLKPIGAAKLLKNVEANSLAYEHLSISRVSCQFSGPQSNASFRINIKAIRDQKILASITKLSIPVGRVLLTPDSVVYVNFIDKNYFVDDYSFLSNFLNIDLDFNTIQAILSNSAFSYRNDVKERDFKTFTSTVESGMYVLQSEKERKVFRMETKSKPAKVERHLKRLDDTALIHQKMYFNADNFALVKLQIEDKTNSRKLEMNFGEFTRVAEKDYPGEINVFLDSGIEKFEARVKMSGFSTEKAGEFGLDIPENYTPVKVN